jgi:hypothetical protein
MVTKPILKAVIFLLVIGTVTALNASADKVVLKDGTVEASTRVWETDGYVHFILKGTRSVEIRYSKEIVDHIEDAHGVIRSVGSKQSDVASSLSPESPRSPPTIAAKEASPSATPMPPIQGAYADRGRPIRSAPEFIERNRNLTFYDPRRPQRYWADRQSQHTSYAAAMAVLAAQYDRPVDWIEKHMGQENDLGAIHASLIAAVEAEASALPAQSNADADSKGVKENTVPAPVEIQSSHFITASLPEPSPEHLKTSAGAQSPVPSIPAGIQFYDPRRPQKYWASPKDHCASLQEAIQLLAKLYGVPAAHVESNLGESNDLSQIHANIQKSLGIAPK